LAEQVIPQEQVQVLPSALGELQMRVIKSEATLQQKEEENTALREQLQQFETRWSEYEVKMKSMEEMWQKQMASLQVSLHVHSYVQLQKIYIYIYIYIYYWG
jgi:myosin-5